MENPLRYSKATQHHALNLSKQRHSGYEPSDTETELQTSWRDRRQNSSNGDVKRNNPSPLKKMNSSMFDFHNEKESSTSPIRKRYSSKSPYKPRRDGADNVSPILNERNVSPLQKSDRQRQIPHKSKPVPRVERASSNQQTNYGRRSATAPKQRPRDRDHMVQKGERTISPMSRNMNYRQKEAMQAKIASIGKINEIAANAKISRAPLSKAPHLYFDSTDSISQGDIFFSVAGLATQKNILHKNGVTEKNMYNNMPENQYPRPAMYTPENNGPYQQNQNGQIRSASSGYTRTSTTTSSSAVSRQNSMSSKMTDASEKTTISMQKFTANRRKSQSEPWFACMRKGTCRTSRSPEKEQFDEASYIEKACVVESLRMFWTEKHQPGSFDGFTCHKKEAQLLKELVSHDICPHILFKGPSGSGKKALTMALLREVYGDQCRNVSQEFRYFHAQDKRQMQVVVPITSSPHHVELNVKVEANAKYALMGIVKEISTAYSIAPEVSTATFKPDYKVIVLYEVEKAPENVLHLIKWIMDCHNDVCKLILCCEDDSNIVDSVRNHCKVINVDAPVTHEIMEVLIQIAKREDFDLPMSFAAKIASKSKQNLRKAIMALEACKAHNYPFSDDQPIPIGWEEVLVELAVEILADPSPKRLFLVRGKLQKMLVDFVHPRLILQKLVEQFLKGVNPNSRREVFYWHAYYNKRLPTGTTALLKLEEFVAKFMSIHRKTSMNRHLFTLNDQF